MAININNKLLSVAFKNLYGDLYDIKKNNKILSINFFLILITNIKIFIINIIRQQRKRYFLSTIKIQESNYKYFNLKTNLKKNSSMIQSDIMSKGYYFCENFLDHEFYDFLNKNFPATFELHKSKQAIKNYNMGYFYGEFSKFSIYSEQKCSTALNCFYKHILSDNFETEINNIFNINENKFICRSIVTSTATEKSFLIPHIDHISTENRQLSLNFIYFVDGNNDDITHSGGTSIYKDNEGLITLCEPTSLKNSLLIYNNSANFFHGFKIIKKNCFRKAISFQFHNEL